MLGRWLTPPRSTPAFRIRPGPRLLAGGKDNFEADRQAGDRAAIKIFPHTVQSAVACRAFLARVVHYLACEAGIRQFLDIGTGLPSGDNVHEVAQRVAPESRVFSENDLIVLLHA